MTKISAKVVAVGALFSIAACSSHNGATPSGNPSSVDSDNDSGSGGGNRGTDGSTVTPIYGSGSPSLGTTIGQCTDPDCALPKAKVLPTLTNVVGIEREDSVGVDFDPIDDAMDYRIYPLPADADVTVAGDAVTIKNAIYRCAGKRQTFDAVNPLNKSQPNLVTGQNGGPYVTVDLAANPTLGYVYLTPASDRSPVYAVAGHPMIGESGWRETRFKIYTTSTTERQSYLGQNWRDDGIVFYVPSVASGSTQTIYASATAEVVAGQGWTHNEQYYFGESDKSDHAKDTTAPTAAFQVLSASSADTVPLMASSYVGWAQGHTELSAGKERFHRAAYQGDGPLWHVEWSGVKQPTTFVVEALATGCPYQGMLSPTHLDAPPHQTFYTLAELQKASATGEVFINGEYDTQAFPKAVARSFLKVVPQPHAADWDWYQGFGTDDFGMVTTLKPCGWDGCRMQSPTFDFSAYNLDAPSNVAVFTYGQFQGQLWTVLDDTGSDVTGKLRFTATKKANVSSDPNQFVHVTMSVNIVDTDRRYPQLIISDQNAPVQEGLSNANNNTILLQTIGGPNMRLEAQAFHGLVNGKAWDVNNQATAHPFIDYDNPVNGAPGANVDTPPSPTDAPFEHAGMDRLTKFDAYVSNQRMYVFFEGAPAGCMTYPEGFVLNGDVTITFGDVLYHEGAGDEGVCQAPSAYSFMNAHQCTETKRHFDDLAFKSGTVAPKWDEKVFPCTAY